MESTRRRGAGIRHLVEIQHFLCPLSVGNHERMCASLESKLGGGESCYIVLLGCVSGLCTGKLCAFHAYGDAEKKSNER